MTGLAKVLPGPWTTAGDREGPAAPPPREAGRQDAERARRPGSRLGTVVGLASGSVGLGALGYTLARTGHAAPALPLFFSSVTLLFAVCAWRLVGVEARRRERVGVSLVLGLGFFALYVLRSPLLFNGFDELIHGANLAQLLNGHSLALHNTVLPVSPYYPGLELVTAAVKWTTGLPVVAAQTVVLAAARVVLVLSVFLVVERVCGSARAGGIGVLVYAANPQFFRFDAQYGYETLALALAAALVHLLTTVVDRRRAAQLTSLFEPPARPDRSDARDMALVVCGLAALALTHHLTSWLTVLFLVFAGYLLRPSAGRALRPLYVAIGIGLLLVGGWTALVGERLWNYLGPIFQAAVTEASSALGRLHTNRQLFHSVAGGSRSPTWEIALMLAAAALWCAAAVVGVVRSWRGPRRRATPSVWLPALVAAAYPIALLASVSSASSEVGVRATSFIFFGVAVVVGGWLAVAVMRRRSATWRGGLLAVASVALLGSLLFGSGPDWSLVPGKFLVSADQRSVGRPSLALAHWAAAHLPPGSHVAADRDNGVLLEDMAAVEPVTAIGGLVNVSPLYFDPTIAGYETSLIRKADIRYLVVDTRLVSGLPEYGTYFEPDGQKLRRLTTIDLAKFDSMTSIRRVYDNGPIRVYDLSGLLGSPSAGVPVVRQSGGRSGADPVVEFAALAVVALVVVRVRRRRGGVRRPETVVLRWMVGSIAAGIALGACLVPTHLSPTAMGLGALALVAGVTVAATRRPPDTASPESRPRPARTWAQPVVAAVGTLLFAVSALSCVLAARGEWHPGPSLTLVHPAPGSVVAEVTAPTGHVTSLRVEVLGTVLLFHTDIPAGAHRSVKLPLGAALAVAAGAARVTATSGTTTLEVG